MRLYCYKITCKVNASGSCKLNNVCSVTSSSLFSCRLGGFNAKENEYIDTAKQGINCEFLCPLCVVDEILTCTESFHVGS